MVLVNQTRTVRSCAHLSKSTSRLGKRNKVYENSQVDRSLARHYVSSPTKGLKTIKALVMHVNCMQSRFCPEIPTRIPNRDKRCKVICQFKVSSLFLRSSEFHPSCPFLFEHIKNYIPGTNDILMMSSGRGFCRVCRRTAVINAGIFHFSGFLFTCRAYIYSYIENTVRLSVWVKIRIDFLISWTIHSF